MSNIYFDDANEEDDGRPRFYLQRAAGWMPLPRTLDAVLSEWDRDAIASMLGPAAGKRYLSEGRTKILWQRFRVMIRVANDGTIHNRMLMLESGEEGELVRGDKPDYKGKYYCRNTPELPVDAVLKAEYFTRNSPYDKLSDKLFEGVFSNLSDVYCPPSGLWCTVLGGDDVVLFHGPVPKASRLDVFGCLIFKTREMSYKISTFVPFELLHVEEEDGTLYRTTYSSYKEAAGFVSRPNEFGIRLVLDYIPSSEFE